MKKLLILFLIASLSIPFTEAQQVTQALSKTSQKGSLYNAFVGENGDLSLSYGYKKKKEESFVNYIFDASLKLLKEDETSSPRECAAKEIDKPTLKYEYISTTVGGCGSFDILSMNLNVSKYTVTETWNNKRQYYESSYIREKISVGTDKDNKYKLKGYVGYFNAETGSNLVLAKEINKDKDDGVQYKLYKFSLDGSVTDISIGELGTYTLVYSALTKINPAVEDKYTEKNLAEYHALFLFAPFKNSGAADAKDFVLLVTDGDGNTIFKSTIKMPMIATTFMEMQQDGKDLYFFGLTSDGKGPNYRYEFMDFSNISNPCYPDFYNYRDNQRENDVLKCKTTNLVLMKLSNYKLDYITLTSADILQSKKAVPPSEKKAPKGDFSRFNIEAFDVLPNGDIMVSGQKKVIITIDQVSRFAYEDITCFHFDNKGNLRAEYCVEPSLAIKKTDKIFQMMQKFVMSEDQSKVHWILYEPETKTGYASYKNLVDGVSTIYAAFQLEIFKIDIATAKVSNSELPLGKELLLNGSYPIIETMDKNTVIFFGQNRKNDEIGLTTYSFK
jgi:hypothetical protein